MSRAREFADLAGSADAGGLTGRNLIINGAMQVAQRGTSSTSAGGYYTVDRIYWAKNSTTELAVTTSQSTEAPEGFSNSWRVQVTTAETAQAAGELVYFLYQGEGQDFQHLKYGTSNAEKVTLSFWVRSSVTGTYSVLFYLTDDTRACTHTYTVNTANTWEHKTITVDGDTTGVIDNDNGSGFALYFTLSAGSSNKGTGSTSFNAYTGTDFADSNQVNFAAQTGNYYITGIQLEVGDKATPFEHRSFADQLARCQRYFYRIGEAVVNSNAQFTLQGRSLSSNRSDGTLMLPTPMRAVPSVSVYESSSTTLYPSNEAAITLSGETYSIVGNDSAFTDLNHVNVRTSGGGTITNGHAVNQRYSGAISLNAEL